jgi:hypothetical protein
MYHYNTTFTNNATAAKMWIMNSRKSNEEVLAKILSIIRKKPGIRPSELNRILHREHSASLRNTLIKRGLVRKAKKGTAVHYFPR